MVLGCGRSGTSIFGELFDALPEFEYHSEPDFEVWLHRARTTRTAVKVPTESPGHPPEEGLSFPLHAVDSEHPGTQVFWIVRHPLDAISSLRVGIADGWGHHPRPADWRAWADRSLVERCAHHWATINRFGYEQVAERATVVTFEDLIARPQHLADTICAAVGIDPAIRATETGDWSARVQDTNNEAFVEAMTSRPRSRADHTVRVGRWRENLSDEEVERAAPIVADTASSFGYRLP